MGRIVSSDVTTAITARCRAAGEGAVHRGERQTDRCRVRQGTGGLNLDTDIHDLWGNCASIAEPFVFNLVPSFCFAFCL